MNEALEHLAQQFEAWRSQPKRPHKTPEHLIQALAALIGTLPTTQLVRRLGIGYGIIQRATQVKANLETASSLALPEQTFIPLPIETREEASIQQPEYHLPTAEKTVQASVSLAGTVIHLHASPESMSALLVHWQGGLQTCST